MDCTARNGPTRLAKELPSCRQQDRELSDRGRIRVVYARTEGHCDRSYQSARTYESSKKGWVHSWSRGRAWYGVLMCWVTDRRQDKRKGRRIQRGFPIASGDPE